MTSSTVEALKPLPCPFCGGKPVLHEIDWCEPPQWAVTCPCTPHAATQTEAIAAWNTRPQIEAQGSEPEAAEAKAAFSAWVAAQSHMDPYDDASIDPVEDSLTVGNLRHILAALTRPDPSLGSQEDAAALRGYRAATHWIGADSWDGCSECMEVLRLATHNDANRDMSGDEIAVALKELRAKPSPPSLGMEGVREALDDCQSTLQAVRDIPPNQATRMMIDRSTGLARQALFGELKTFLTAEQFERLLDAARAEGPGGSSATAIADDPLIRSGNAKDHTPSADEVGRAVERLTSRAASIERMTYAESAAWAAEKREHAADLRLILSHVSRLEARAEAAEKRAEFHRKKWGEDADALKLAVEALESLTSAVEMQHGSMCPANTCTCDLNETLWLQGRSAREALRSIRSPIRGSDLESASQSASPPLRQDKEPAAPDGCIHVLRVMGGVSDPCRTCGPGPCPIFDGTVAQTATLAPRATALPMPEYRYQTEDLTGGSAVSSSLSRRTTEGRSGVKDDKPSPTNMDTSGQSGGEG